MKTILFRTIARVYGARKAKRLISDLAFSEQEDSDVNENCCWPLYAFNGHIEVRGYQFWCRLENKYLKLTYKPCSECNDNPDVDCSLCSIPF